MIILSTRPVQILDSLLAVACTPFKNINRKLLYKVGCQVVDSNTDAYLYLCTGAPQVLKIYLSSMSTLLIIHFVFYQKQGVLSIGLESHLFPAKRDIGL